MFKNIAAQKFIVFAFDSVTNLPKTGDAANITAYISKDYGAVTVLADTTATEMDAVNAKGYYLFDAAQAETNADVILSTAKSSTANIVVVGAPSTIFTLPQNFGATSIDVNGRVDVIKIAGTTQTARDVGGLVDAAVSSRLPTASYSAPDNASVATILTRTDVATSTRLAGAGYTAPDNTGIGTILTRTDVATSTRMASYTQPAGFLGSTFPATVGDATAASQTTINANVSTRSAPGDAMSLTAGERNSTADALLNRDMATGTDSGGRTVRNALRFLRNKWSIAAGSLTVTKEDDTTTAWTSAVASTPGADPITGNDPT